MGKNTALMIASAVDRVNALLPAANAGDTRAIAQLREVMDAHPELWEAVGDLVRQAEQSLIRAAVGGNSVQKEALMRKMDSLRRDLAGPFSSALERLLIDRIAVCWLALAVAEGTYHQALSTRLDRGDDEFHQRRVERAQRRYLAAIKTLAQVRKLGVPAMQVNIGKKQVNVAGN